VTGARDPYRAISYGGGVQSTAMVVLACTGRIDADIALFANVGDHAEHPATLAYVHDIAVPWAAEHGLDIVEVQRRQTATKLPDLHTSLMTERDTGSTPIPMRSASGAPMKRNCTASWKVEPIHEWLRDRGHVPAVQLLGISVDEIERAGRGESHRDFPRDYPLLHLGLSRDNCEQVIRDAGLPVPPKSACYFCPFHKPQTWAELRRDEPDLFDKAQQLEDVMLARRSRLDMTPLYLTRFGKRLSDAVPVAQDSLFNAAATWGTDIGEDGCDEGVCFV
jgi:hypothetical protein